MFRWLLKLTAKSRFLNFSERLHAENLHHVHDRPGDLKAGQRSESFLETSTISGASLRLRRCRRRRREPAGGTNHLLSQRWTVYSWFSATPDSSEECGETGSDGYLYRKSLTLPEFSYFLFEWFIEWKRFQQISAAVVFTTGSSWTFWQVLTSFIIMSRASVMWWMKLSGENIVCGGFKWIRFKFWRKLSSLFNFFTTAIHSSQRMLVIVAWIVSRVRIL